MLYTDFLYFYTYSLDFVYAGLGQDSIGLYVVRY